VFWKWQKNIDFTVSFWFKTKRQAEHQVTDDDHKKRAKVLQQQDYLKNNASERIHINSKPNGDRVCVYVRLIEKGWKRERLIERNRKRKEGGGKGEREKAHSNATSTL